MTGIILEAAKRFQLNTFVSKNFHPGKPKNNTIIPGSTSFFPFFIPKIPAFWLSQTFSAVDHPGLLTKFGQQIRWLVLVTNFPLVLLVIAICGNLAAFFIGFKIHSQARRPRRSQARSLKELGKMKANSNETLERQNLTTFSRNFTGTNHQKMPKFPWFRARARSCTRAQSKTPRARAHQFSKFACECVRVRTHANTRTRAHARTRVFELWFHAWNCFAGFPNVNTLESPKNQARSANSLLNYFHH